MQLEAIACYSTKEALIGTVLWDISKLYPTDCTRRISLLLTLVLGFASDSCNNNDILLVVGYNYNILA